MNASAACLRGSLLVRRAVLSISLTGASTSFASCCQWFATEACSELRRFISECCPMHRIHLFGAPRTHCAPIIPFRAQFDPRAVARFSVSALFRALARWPSKYLRQGGICQRNIHHYSTGARLTSSKHCSEGTIPKLGSDTVVSIRKPVMVEVMFEQGGRQNCRIVMGAIMDK